jgi:hypothetical protein
MDIPFYFLSRFVAMAPYRLSCVDGLRLLLGQKRALIILPPGRTDLAAQQFGDFINPHANPFYQMMNKPARESRV